MIPSKHSIPQDLYSPCLNSTNSARNMFTPTMFTRRRRSHPAGKPPGPRAVYYIKCNMFIFSLFIFIILFIFIFVFFVFLCIIILVFIVIYFSFICCCCSFMFCHGLLFYMFYIDFFEPILFKITHE